MALKRSPKDVDPKTGARIASKSLYGKKAGGETISSWPDVRNMYKSGKLKIDNLKNYDKPVVDYITGATDKISDVEYDEPRLSVSKTLTGGSKNDVRFDYKPGGGLYNKALAAEKKTSGKNFPKESADTERQYYAGMASGKMGSFGSGGSRSKNPTIDAPTVKKTEPREDIGRMTPLKASFQTSSPKPRKAEEAESWNAPTRTRGGGSVFKGDKIPVKKSNEKEPKGYTYGKERKMATAYYGIGDAVGEEGRYATSGELSDFQKRRKGDIKDMKSERAETKGRVNKKEITKSIKEGRKEITEAKLGQKYVESLPNRYQSIAGVAKDDIRGNKANEKVVEGANKPKRVVRTFTPEAMKGSTEKARQSMLTEKKKVKNLGPKQTIRPRNR
jgi:hypothetical protein